MRTPVRLFRDDNDFIKEGNFQNIKRFEKFFKNFFIVLGRTKMRSGQAVKSSQQHG